MRLSWETEDERAILDILIRGIEARNRGRDIGQPCPSLRTGLADFPHPALQLVVILQEDWHAAAYACFKEYKPTAEK